MLVRRPQRHRLQRGGDRHPVLRPDDVARARAARHRRAQHPHRIRPCHRRIVVGGEHHPPAHQPAGRRDVLRPLRPQDGIAVPVAPVEGVHREQRREDAELADRIHLVRTQRMAVDEHRPAVAGPVAARRLPHRFDHQVDRGVAAGMRQDLPVALVAAGEGLDRRLGRRRLQAAVIRRRAGGRHEVGARQPSRLALRGAVERDLGTADAQPVAVGRAMQRAAELFRRAEDVGIGDDVDRQKATTRRLGQLRDGRAHGAAFLGGGVAEGGVKLRARLDHRQPGRLVQPAEQGPRADEQRILLHHAVGLARSGAAAEHAPQRVGRGRGDARHLQRLGIRCRQVARRMDDQHRNLGRDLVEILARGVAPLAQLAVVVAEAEDQIVAPHGGFIALHPFPQDADDGGDVVGLAIRGGQHVGADRLQADHHDMPMRIDEARQHGAAFEVHHPRPRPAGRLHLPARADGQDAPATDRHGLGRGLRIVDGDDRAAAVDQVGAAAGGGRRLRRGAAQQAAEAGGTGAEREAPQHAAAGGGGRRMQDAAQRAAGKAHGVVPR